MSASIFQPEISSIESQIAALQQRITLLNEAELVADGALQALQGAVEKVTTLAPGALANLRAAVLNLFQGGGNDGNGNRHDEPAPQPNDDGGAEGRVKTEQVVIATQPEPHPAQSCEWASPLASPLTSTLCCHLEDAPASALQGQSLAIACVVSDAPKKPEYIELIPVGNSVAYQRRSHDGEIICTYLGSNNKQKLKLWGEWLCHQHAVGSGFQLRESSRLTNFKYEIKIWGMNLNQIQELAQTNTAKNPPSNYGVAPKRKVEPIAPTPKPLQIDDIEVGDIVRSTTIKDWQYKVLAQQDNGLFSCEQINVEVPIKVTMHPASIELVSKGIKVEDSEISQHILIDVNDVPVGVELQQTDDALLTEYRVWIWCVARVFGKPELQRKCIGSLVEGTQGITAHRPHGMDNAQSFECTLDATKHLIRGANLKLSDIEAAYRQHQEETASASPQNPSITPEQAKADLFGGGYDDPLTQQQIEAGDWVELLVNGERYQVDSVDGEGIHLVTGDVFMLVQPDEVKLLFRVPTNWKPF